MPDNQDHDDSDSPGLSDDLWCHIGRCATHSEEGLIDDGGQAKITELQRLTTIMVFKHLRNVHNKVRKTTSKDVSTSFCVHDSINELDVIIRVGN